MIRRLEAENSEKQKKYLKNLIYLIVTAIAQNPSENSSVLLKYLNCLHFIHLKSPLFKLCEIVAYLKRVKLVTFSLIWKMDMSLLNSR